MTILADGTVVLVSGVQEVLTDANYFAKISVGSGSVLLESELLSEGFDEIDGDGNATFTASTTRLLSLSNGKVKATFTDATVILRPIRS